MHSGTALLALYFDCPVLVSNQGVMSELHARVGADWMRTYDGTLTAGILADASTTSRRSPDVTLSL
jgi:hypothetical protein